MAFSFSFFIPFYLFIFHFDKGHQEKKYPQQKYHIFMTFQKKETKKNSLMNKKKTKNPPKI
jgi:hypothetical protein